MQASPISLISFTQQRTLLHVAKEAIQLGLTQQRPWQPRVKEFPEALGQLAASFVTLKKMGSLRGCIGTLDAYQPLVQDVALHAYDAAFRDPRFNPLSLAECATLGLEISLLSDPEPLPRGLSEAQLLGQLSPNQDGLIIRQGALKAVFLPQVWQQLPEPDQFLKHLKLKGGWSEASPTEQMECAKFQVQEFGASWQEIKEQQG